MNKEDIFNKLKGNTQRVIELKMNSNFSQELIDIQIENYKLFDLFMKSKENFDLPNDIFPNAFINAIFFCVSDVYMLNSAASYTMHLHAMIEASEEYFGIIMSTDAIIEYFKIENNGLGWKIINLASLIFYFRNKKEEFQKLFSGQEHSLLETDIKIFNNSSLAFVVPYMTLFELSMSEDSSSDPFETSTWEPLIDFLGFSMKTCRNKHQFKFVYDQIFEFLRRAKRPEKVVHYTSIEALEKIVNSKSLRISSTNSVDDYDEGAIWSKEIFDIKKNDNINVLSFTGKEDSLDLWGNYTKYNGVAIVFSQKILSELVAFSSVNDDASQFQFTHADSGSIKYINSFPEEITTIFNYIKGRITEKFDANTIKYSEEGLEMASNIHSYLYKKLPFKHEFESRVIISADTFGELEKHFEHRNFKIDDQHVYKNINLDEIEKIIMGPGIKNSKMMHDAIKKLFAENGRSDVVIGRSEANIKT